MSQSRIKQMLACLLLATLIGASCTTTGHFTSNPRERMAFAGAEFILTKSDSFQIRSWTDVSYIYVDGSGNRIWNDNKYLGTGIYQKNGDSLFLQFTSSDSISVRINYKNDGITKTFEISLFDELGRPNKPQFQIEDPNNVKLRNVYFPNKYTYILNFKKEENPATLELTGYRININKPIINLNNLQLGLNEIKFKTYNGYFAFNDTLNIWFKPTFTGIRYEFRGKRKWLPKKWRFKLLNKLYRDY